MNYDRGPAMVFAAPPSVNCYIGYASPSDVHVLPDQRKVLLNLRLTSLNFYRFKCLPIRIAFFLSVLPLPHLIRYLPSTRGQPSHCK